MSAHVCVCDATLHILIASSSFCAQTIMLRDAEINQADLLACGFLFKELLVLTQVPLCLATICEMRDKIRNVLLRDIVIIGTQVLRPCLRIYLFDGPSTHSRQKPKLEF